MNESKLNHLEKSIDNRIRTVNDAKFGYRKVHQYIALSVAALAALNTILVAYSQTEIETAKIFGYLAIIISAAVAVANSIDGIFKPREKHVQNAEALNELFDIRAKLRWRKLDEKAPLSDNEIDDFFSKFRQLEHGFFQAITKIQIEDRSPPGGK